MLTVSGKSLWKNEDSLEHGEDPEPDGSLFLSAIRRLWCPPVHSVRSKKRSLRHRSHNTHTGPPRARTTNQPHTHTHTSLSILAGYVTGLEPATGYATTRAVERKYGRVPTLGPGESRTFHLEYEVLSARPPAISLFSLPSLHTRTQHLSSALHTLLCLMPRSALLLTLLCLLCSVGFNSLS